VRSHSRAAWRLGAVLLLLFTPSAGRAQDPPPDLQAQVFRAETEVVVLDLVARDKKGHTVRDLRPEEVQVFEDGVKQEASGFRFLDTRAAGVAVEEEQEATGGAQASAPSTQDERRHLNLVTMVFDQLGPDGRQIARKAALDFLDLADRPDVFVSVFQVSESLKLVQQFTTNRDLVRDGVLSATGQLATGFTQATDALVRATRESEEAKDRLQTVGQSITSAAGANNAAQIGREASIAELAVNALRLTETLQREQQGRSSLFSLLALARKQQVLAGRKTILFFSEGLQTPPSLEHVLQATISEANRANVSVYAIDARGLLTANQLESTRAMLNQASATSQRQQLLRGQVPVTREEMLIADNAEASLRMDVQGALADLAEGTGGTLIANTNDMRANLSRTVGDLAGYYEIAYTPTNREYDGHFRRLSVKVTRPSVTVQARSGYYAVPPGEANVTFPYELDLLKALRGNPAPHEFPLRTRAFHFGYEQGSLRHTLVIEMPLRGVAFEDDPKTREDRAHFSFMGLVRSPTGFVAEKFSQDYPFSVPRARLEALRQGNAVFLRSFLLAPGKYSLETAAMDQRSHRASVERMTMDVPEARSTLRLSSIAVIKRVEPVAEGALASDDPFRLDGSRIVPFVGDAEIVSGIPLNLFLVAYPEPRALAKAELTLEFRRDGELVGRSKPQLPPPDAQGRIPYIASIPAEAFKPGLYQVRAVLQQGSTTADEWTSVRIGAP
jgi:VWFA-related protein